MSEESLHTMISSIRPELLHNEEMAVGFLTAKDLTKNDLRFFIVHFLSHLREAAIFNVPEILQEYINWNSMVLGSRGITAEDYSSLIESIKETLSTTEEVAQTDATREILSEISAPGTNENNGHGSLIDRGHFHGQLAGDLLELMLEKRRDEAIQLILEVVDDGESIEDVYLNVINIVLAETGRLWQENKLTVLQEHYITALCQVIMNQLFPRIISTPKTGRRLVACCIGEELHEIGVRMVADIFELHGWDSYYVGANTPSQAIVNGISENSPQLLAISVTGMQFFSRVRETIQLIRQSGFANSLSIMVGGHAFNRLPAMRAKVGADLYSASVKQALVAANKQVA